MFFQKLCTTRAKIFHNLYELSFSDFGVRSSFGFGGRPPGLSALGLPMKLLFCVQGEGRGHLTQTMAVKQTVEAHGHQVVGVMVGLSSNRSLPEYFESAMRVPLVILPTVEFVYTQ